MPLTDLSNLDVRLRNHWDSELQRTADGAPTLPPSFVATAGPRVWLVDVRDDAELTGSDGHVPGVSRAPFRELGEVASRLPPETPVILICDDGARSSIGARFLAQLGMTSVASMQGGMRRWRAEGFVASRTPKVLSRRLEAPKAGAGSDGRLLNLPAGDRKLSKERIIEHVGDLANVRWAKLASVLVNRQTTCVDGREDGAIIGTPGGDAGELLLGLTASEQVGNTKVDLSKVPDLVRAFADTFGGLYLHTDNHALNRLARALRADNRLEWAVSHLTTVSQWVKFLRRPPEVLRGAVLEHMLKPEHVGCGHIKLALMNADTYGIRPELITAFFSSFFQGLWEGASDLTWVVLGGDHAEGAVVNVTVEGELGPFSPVPLVAPLSGGVQMFVNHPQAVGYLRRQSARFLSGPVSNLLPTGPKDHKNLLEAIPELGGAQTLATLKALAAGLPVFEARFEPGGGLEVTQGDSIPD